MSSGRIKKLLYRSGLLSLFHRVRNARTLTVIMFHRVLQAGDPRWNGCDPAYALSADLFRQCLEFFAAHYNIVSAQALAGACRGELMLPPRALLITFDDGWADNVQYALPHMRELGAPGLMFVAMDAVGRDAPFYQEQIVSAWRRGVLSVTSLGAALRRYASQVSTPAANEWGDLRELIAQIESLPVGPRTDLLLDLSGVLDDGMRHMVTVTELHTLDSNGVAIGLHGKTHTPMTAATDLDAELAGARAAMADLMPQRPSPITMSFPHGRFDRNIANQARSAGYELVFTSVPILNRMEGKPAWLLGRLGFETDSVADENGVFQPEKLAMYLFRRPRAVLA